MSWYRIIVPALLFFLASELSAFAAEKADLVLIEKSARRLTLKAGNKVLHQYQVALGSTPVGAKQCQGDGKTPEGEYRISGRNAASAYHRSLAVSYPNKADKQTAAKLKCSPGGDIMIHGLPNGRGWIGSGHLLSDWTLGCIAVTDAEIEEIWKLVPDGTRVVIKP